MEMVLYGSEVEVYRARIQCEGGVEVCSGLAYDLEILEGCTEEGWM